MIRPIHPVQLGGSLYIPATHPNLQPVCTHNKYPDLRSCIIDTEDAIDSHEVDDGLLKIRQMLQNYTPGELLLFIRPRNPEILQQLLQIEHIDKIDGFALPKFSTQHMQSYARILADRMFYVMPVLESQDIFEPAKLEQIRNFLLTSTLNVLSLRIGGEDMLNFLGLKRPCDQSIYALNGPAYVIGSMLAIFKPFGFSLSAPVFNCIDKADLYLANVQEDLAQGLMGKTIIHPNQISPINEVYKVTSAQLSMAQKMVDRETKAIISEEGQMGEKSAHWQWAENILKRHRFYGLASEKI